MQNGSVLNTYHYTRTYIDYWGQTIADSDRVWGYGTVVARGPFVLRDIWDIGVHKVFYGTNN